MNKSQSTFRMPAQKVLSCVYMQVKPFSCTRDFLLYMYSPLMPPLQIKVNLVFPAFEAHSRSEVT